jgi:hypothetical protein
MSGTIRTVYTEEPRFPATDQHPSAVRYHVGSQWVDAIGGQPTPGEIDAFLHPEPPPSDADGLMMALATIDTSGSTALEEMSYILMGFGALAQTKGGW